MYKNKSPYTLDKGELVMVSDGDLRKVNGVKWSPREMRYEVIFEDGSKIWVPKISTVPVWCEEKNRVKA